MKMIREKVLTKSMREFCGMSQKELADLLGISRSHLSMMDTNARDITNLPPVDYDFIARIHMAINMNAGKKEALKDEKLTNSLENQKENLKVLAQKRIEKIKHKIMLAEDSLSAIKAEQERSSTVIKVLPFLSENATTKYELFISCLEMEARLVQSEKGVDAQLDLESQMAGLRAEMDFLEQLIKD